MTPNAIPSSGPDLAATIARQRLAKREEQYAKEVRRLLQAGRDLMRRCGTRSSPRVADIVAESGLSNDAFYRHFASKEALVVAIIQDGAARLASYLQHQMSKRTTPESRVREWIQGVMSQAADDEIAATTSAVLWNAGRVGDSPGLGQLSQTASLARLLHEPFADLGSSNPEADASLAAHAAVGVLSDFLWQGLRPSRAEIEHVVEFCLAAVITQPRSASTSTERR